MINDVDLMMLFMRITLFGAAVATTAFPILYSLSPWRSTSLGRVVMLQAVAFALAVDITLLFEFWVPENPVVLNLIRASLFALIAASASGLTWMLFKLNHLMQIQGKKDRRAWLRRTTRGI